jgi:hypothetical protein
MNNAKLFKDIKSNIKSNRLSTYVIGKRIKARNGFKYILNEKYGKVDKQIKKAIAPHRMLSLGVFSGKYLNDDVVEYPVEWFINAIKKNKLSPENKDCKINRFKVASRMSLQQWIKNGWIVGKDDKGWFQWWCRYYIGLRRPTIDEKQIKRWLAYKRHWSQLKKHISKSRKYKDPTFRAKQRQSLLQWGWKQPDLI